MKLITWNVNGIRAVQKAGFLDWFEKQDADVVCLQETKAQPEQLDMFLMHPEGYDSHWHSAKKPGYSGTAIYSKKEPLSIIHGIGSSAIDDEGRVLTAEFKDFYVVNAYFPNSQRELLRLPYKLAFCSAMLKHTEKLKAKGKHVILCGDLNIAHKEIDLKNPKSNQKNAGFLPEERAWLDTFTEKGYIDAFRHFNKDPGHYTWWSYRPGVRAKNVGWRLDYFFTNGEFKSRLAEASHQHEVMGSDHCPVILRLKK